MTGMTADFGAARRPDQGFVDALGGPDGTGDPAAMMPVLEVYPDALSAPMPDVALPPLDLARILATRPGLPAPPPTPAQARVARERADRVAQPGRAGHHQPPPRQSPAWGSPQPRVALAPPMSGPRQPGANQLPTPPSSSAWTGRTLSPGEMAGLLRTTFAGITRGSGGAPVQQHQPQAHAPTPPLPRRLPRTTRRNKGSSLWAVIIFLVVIAFASGLAQQLLRMLSELFNR